MNSHWASPWRWPSTPRQGGFFQPAPRGAAATPPRGPPGSIPPGDAFPGQALGARVLNLPLGAPSPEAVYVKSREKVLLPAKPPSRPNGAAFFMDFEDMCLLVLGFKRFSGFPLPGQNQGKPLSPWGTSLFWRFFRQCSRAFGMEFDCNIRVRRVKSTPFARFSIHQIHSFPLHTIYWQ